MQQEKTMTENTADRERKTGDPLPSGQLNSSGSRLKPILILFAAAFLIHTGLNLFIKQYPTIKIDEGLYTNIARSLAWKGEPAYRGQPVNYPYLLYPMLLVPLYWLNRLFGGDIFRWIQVFNTLLICSSVIPAALFAYDFTKDTKAMYRTAFLTAIMPDMVMGGYAMTESLIWPLSLWMIFAAYRFYQDHEVRYGLLTALCTGLMFAVKPGAVAVGAVLLAGYCILSAKQARNRLKQAALSAALLLLIVGAVYAIFQLFHPADFSLLGLYTKQTSGWTFKTIFVVLEGFFLMIFLFTFACGGVYGLIPLTHLNKYEPDRRPFVLFFSIGIFAALLGTAVFVVPFQWEGGLGQLPLHLRYCAMYIPVMYVPSQGITAKPGRTFALTLGAFIILAIFPGARAAFVEGKSAEVDSLALSAFLTTPTHNGDADGWIITAALILFSCFVLFFVIKKGLTPKLQKLCFFFFTAFLIFNTVCAHIVVRVYIDPSIASDAREINAWIGDDDCLGITQRYYDDFYSFWLDSRLNQPMQQVTIDQMIMAMADTIGVYSPFVPVDQAPNVNDHLTPDTDKFVLGKTIAEHLELNPGVTARTTSSGNFTFAEIRSGELWADTMMYGLDRDRLYPGGTAYIYIFDEKRSTGDGIKLSITAAGDGALFIGDQKLDLSDEEKTFEISVPSADYIEINSDNGVRILKYSTNF